MGKEEKNVAICDLCDHNIGNSKCGLSKEVYKIARYKDECDGFNQSPDTYDVVNEPTSYDDVKNEDLDDEVEDMNSHIEYLINHDSDTTLE